MGTGPTVTWHVRLASTAAGEATAYLRQHRLTVGVPVHFDSQYGHVTALELFLAAIGAELTAGLTDLARRQRLIFDSVEAVISGQLHNPLVYLGVKGEEGHPGLAQITAKVYVSTPEPEQAVHGVWQRFIERAPLTQTLRQAVELDVSLKLLP